MSEPGRNWAEGVWAPGVWANGVWAQDGDPPPDTTPNQFTFVDQSGVSPSTVITSAGVTISGINTAITFTASGGTIDVNGDGNFQASRQVANGDTIRARTTSSESYSTTVNVTVTGGGVPDVFSVTTMAEPVTPPDPAGPRMARIYVVFRAQ